MHFHLLDKIFASTCAVISGRDNLTRGPVQYGVVTAVSTVTHWLGQREKKSAVHWLGVEISPKYEYR